PSALLARQTVRTARTRVRMSSPLSPGGYHGRRGEGQGETEDASRRSNRRRRGGSPEGPRLPDGFLSKWTETAWGARSGFSRPTDPMVPRRDGGESPVLRRPKCTGISRSYDGWLQGGCRR